LARIERPLRSTPEPAVQRRVGWGRASDAARGAVVRVLPDRRDGGVHRCARGRGPGTSGQRRHPRSGIGPS
jgi:hypothetical protein